MASFYQSDFLVEHNSRVRWYLYREHLGALGSSLLLWVLSISTLYHYEYMIVISYSSEPKMLCFILERIT